MRGRRKTKSSAAARLLPIVFFLSGCLLLTVAMGLYGLAFVNRPVDSSDAFAWKPPMEQVNNSTLVPETLFISLTGIESADALNATLDKGDLENAYALVAYDPNLTDPTRIGALLQLGAQYAMAKDLPKTISCFQSAAMLATISPALSDPARMDVYQQSIAGLRTAGANNTARWITDQSYLVAQYSSALRRDARARRLEQIADAYSALGAGSLAGQARAKAADASALSETANAPLRIPFSPSVGKLPPNSAVNSLRTARVAAAKQLMDDLANPPAGAVVLPADSVAQLRDSLVSEDDARREYYGQQIPLAKDPTVQLALLRDKVSWLGIKYRVARGGFGAGIVSDWETDSAAIADDWGNAWADLFQVVQAQAAAATKPQDPVQATEDVIRQELIAVRWGWYNGVAEPDLVSALGDATQRVMKTSAPVLHLDVITRGKKSTFLLVPDELYGQNERALPK